MPSSGLEPFLVIPLDLPRQPLPSIGKHRGGEGCDAHQLPPTHLQRTDSLPMRARAIKRQ
eukprot:539693-Prymnesium_polylepis.1